MICKLIKTGRSHIIKQGIPSNSLLQRQVFNGNFIFSEYYGNNKLSNIQALEKTLQQISFGKSRSVLVDQGEQRIKKFLTKQEKYKLKLYIPKVPFNVRMGITKQQEFRQQVCQNLYQMQKAQLQTGVRILEQTTQNQHFTLDRYVNVIYKDIYARYLVSKGVGVSWHGQYADYGVMNPTDLPLSPENLISKFLNNNFKYLQKTTTIGPYSYREAKYIPTDLIQVQNIRKMGYFCKLSISNFGKHQSSFKILQQKGHSLHLLVFSQYLQKLINPHALCLIPDKKMVILKKQLILQSQQLKFEYLITSMDLYATNKQYFNQQKYQKHSLFQSSHLIGMKANFVNSLSDGKKQTTQLQIFSELQQYERNGGIYIVNGSTSIQDYERVNHHMEIGILKNVSDNNGVINHFQDVKLSLKDLDLQPKLHAQLKKYINFVQFYNFFEDQIYYSMKTQEPLRFRLYDKYQIAVPQESYQLLHKFIKQKDETSYIFESKIKIPQKQAFKRPKDKRKFKKQVRHIIKQKTDYMTIIEAIDSVTNISVSSLIEGQIKVGLVKNKEAIVKVINQSQFSGLSQQEKLNLEWIMINAELMAALSYVSWTQSKMLPSVIIQPQSFTENMMGMCLHLHYFIKVKTETQQHGRIRKIVSPSMQNLLQLFKLIYLHPTMDDKQKDLPVQDFIKGSKKLNETNIYGYGYQAIRMWVCKNSQYLGDRKLSETQINTQIANSLFIRKIYSQILPFLPTQQSYDKVPQSFLDEFMLNMIDCYILNMENFNQKLMLKEAYDYTIQFYSDIVDQIFVSNIRKKIIAFPNLKENLGHGKVIKRLIEMLGVVSPLMPFSVYQISKNNYFKWPKIQNQKCYEQILEYNKLIKIRIDIQNKLTINRFEHSEIILPQIPISNISNRDLQLFFGVDRVSLEQPFIKQKRFGIQLKSSGTLGKTKIIVFQSKESCIRCDDKVKQSEHLCVKCVDYLQDNIQKNIEFYNPSLDALQFLKLQQNNKKSNLQK